MSLTWMRPDRLLARQVDLGHVTGHDHPRAEPEPREEHLHLLGRRVLGLVEDHERVVSVRPRMNASGATSIVPRSMYAFSRSASIVS